jgi:hypothetical protein
VDCFAACVAAAAIYWSICGKLINLLRRQGVNLLSKKESVSRHWISDLRFIRFVITRQYAKIPDRATRIWGDVLLAWTILVWIFVVGILIFYPPTV